MISTQIDLKAISGDIRKLRAALGKTAEQQGRELASSAGYVAARYSFPIEKGGSAGGARLSAKPQKGQETSILAAISSYWRGSKQSENESVSDLERNHPNRVRAGNRIAKSSRIARFNVSRKAFFSDRDRDTLVKLVSRRVGWNKAAYVVAAIMVNPATKARIPAYINRHVFGAKGKAAIRKGNDGEFEFTLTNYSNQANSLLDSGAFTPALNAATKGQIMRYEAQIRKAIKEARLA